MVTGMIESQMHLGARGLSVFTSILWDVIVTLIVLVHPLCVGHMPQ